MTQLQGIAGPVAGVLTPSARAYVTDSVPDRDCVLVIDSATGSTVASIPVGSHPTAVALSPDGLRAYVATFESGSVSVIDTSANRVVDTIALPLTTAYSAAADLALSPDGSCLYVADWGQSLLFVIETTTHAVTASVAVGANPDAVVATDTHVYVANEADDTVSVVEVTSYTATHTVQVGRGPTGLALVPAAELLYVADNAGGQVTVVDAATLTVVATIPAPGAYQVAVSPDGSRVYVSVSAGILVLDGVTSEVLTTIEIPANSFADVTVGPDGLIYDGHDGPGPITAAVDVFDPDTFERVTSTSFPGVLNSVTVGSVRATATGCRPQLVRDDAY